MKKVLFVCIGNSCRSQMAEGFARNLGGNEIKTRSAGTEAATVLSGKARQVMGEKAIDISNQYPKQLSSEDLAWADRVIVMGCGAEDPKLEDVKERMEDWGIDDPIGRPVETYREIRDQIETKVLDLLERMRRME